MAPKYSKAEEGQFVANVERYKRDIEGLNKMFWSVVFSGLGYEEVSKMDTDTLIEAYAAREKFEKEINKKVNS